MKCPATATPNLMKVFEGDSATDDLSAKEDNFETEVYPTATTLKASLPFSRYFLHYATGDKRKDQHCVGVPHNQFHTPNLYFCIQMSYICTACGPARCTQSKLETCQQLDSAEQTARSKHISKTLVIRYKYSHKMTPATFHCRPTEVC